MRGPASAGARWESPGSVHLARRLVGLLERSRLFQGGSELTAVVEQLHRAVCRQGETADRVLAAAARFLLLGRIEARDHELHAQRVAVERPRTDRIGERLEQIGPILIAQLRRLPLSLW